MLFCTLGWNAGQPHRCLNKFCCNVLFVFCKVQISLAQFIHAYFAQSFWFGCQLCSRMLTNVWFMNKHTLSLIVLDLGKFLQSHRNERGSDVVAALAYVHPRPKSTRASSWGFRNRVLVLMTSQWCFSFINFFEKNKRML